MRKEFLTDEEAPEGYIPKPTPTARALPPRPEDLARAAEPPPVQKVYTKRSDVPEHLRGRYAPEPMKTSKIPPNELARVIQARMEEKKKKRHQRAVEELANPRKSRILQEMAEIRNKRLGKVPEPQEVESDAEENEPARPKGEGASERVRVGDEGAGAAKD